MLSADYLTDVLHLTDRELIEQAISVGEYKKVKKGTCLVWQDERPKVLNFLVKGVFRGFLTDISGKDITDCFLFERGWPVCANVDMTAPAFVNVEALTDAEIVSFPLDQAAVWLMQYPSLQQFYHQILIQTTRRFWEQKIVVCQYTALQRYKWFLSAYPGLIDLVKHRQIASFLGITPVTLSRVRNLVKSDTEVSQDKES